MRPDDQLVELYGEIKRESEKAILFEVSDQGGKPQEVWLPKSQIDIQQSEVKIKGDVGVLIVSEWIAKQKQLA